MKKTLFLLLLVCMLLPSSASAFEITIKIGNIDCPNCIERIHDFFEKVYGKQVQHLKINSELNRVTFDSISIDLNVVRDELENIGFDVLDMTRH